MRAMPTDNQISILVDVASNGGAGLAPEKLLDMIDLIDANYVEAEAGEGELYQLTVKGQRLLADRGVGANEA
jgi:hypothetical protein